MRILLTGGAGYIGSHTAKALTQCGYEPIVLDNLSTGHRWAVQWGPLVKGDVGDAILLDRVLREYSIGAVVHFAANAYVGESMTNPRKYFHNNVVNALTLLDAMLATGVQSIVFSSTCATYGIPECVPITEDHPQRPVNPYGESKLFIERALRWYDQAYGLKSVALRYFNAAGADPDGTLGEIHTPETHLIPLVLETALDNRSLVNIYGTDYPTPDGTAIRDYIHVTDLAEAHAAALRYLERGGTSTAINLGTGSGYSVRQVIATAERVTGRAVVAHHCARREGDPAVLVARVQRAPEMLGWRPKVSDLESIVGTAWEWHSSAVRALQRRAQA